MREVVKLGIKRIAVFDFDSVDREALLEALTGHFGQGAELCAFGDTQSVARAVRDDCYDMAFVAVNGMPAMETARLVRESGGAIPLFLVSVTGEYALEGFRLGVLDYLIQPVSRERIGGAVARIGGPPQQGCTL